MMKHFLIGILFLLCLLNFFLVKKGAIKKDKQMCFNSPFRKEERNRKKKEEIVIQNKC
jgi:hypothetical protein